MNSAVAISEGQTGLFLGRQPILDRHQATVGYELLFRESNRNQADIPSDCQATADVVCKAYSDLGMASALGTQKGFVIVGSEILFSDALELLPQKSAVIELKVSDGLKPETVARCRELSKKGYEIALSDAASFKESVKALAGVATYLKIGSDAENLTKGTMPALRSGGAKLIATRVETREAHQRCSDLGFDFYQGYFFAHPTIIEGQRLDPSVQGLFRLIELLNSDANVNALETVFKHEPALTVNLLRLVNSVGAGLVTKVNSIQHAITVIGRRQLMRWLQLLVFANRGNADHIAKNPLMQLAALRGYFMELLASRCYPGKRELRDQAFLAGLMSLMPAALGMPMTTILTQIAVAPELRRALSRKEGDLGNLLALTERYDDSDLPGTAAALAKVGGGMPISDLAHCLTEAIAWVQQLSSG